MKLNCDMGESFGQWVMGKDVELMPLIDMANIACGFHASDPDTMSKTVALAVEHDVLIGAHPSYFDIQGFGRRSIPHTQEQITHAILYQVGALQGICLSHNTEVAYIKPHGALYNDMMNNLDAYLAVLKASKILNLPLMILANDNTGYQQLAESMGITLIHESFCDRKYTQQKLLAPRDQENAVINDLAEALQQASALIQHQAFPTIDGHHISIQADTLCVHSDGEHAVQFAREMRHLITSQMSS